MGSNTASTEMNVTLQEAAAHHALLICGLFYLQIDMSDTIRSHQNRDVCLVCAEFLASYGPRQTPGEIVIRWLKPLSEEVWEAFDHISFIKRHGSREE